MELRKWYKMLDIDGPPNLENRVYRDSWFRSENVGSRSPVFVIQLKIYRYDRLLTWPNPQGLFVTSSIVMLKIARASLSRLSKGLL